MNLTRLELPVPDDDAIAVSRALEKVIVAEIEQSGGWIPFERYMELALYEPGLGYYANGSVKLGAAGDFITAADLGDWLPATLARWFARALDELAANIVLELGAGTGRMAESMLDGLQAMGRGELRYWILEPSAELRARQRRRLRRFGDRVEWLDELPRAPFDGVIFANEVVDALPVARFNMRAGRSMPLGVSSNAEGFRWQIGAWNRELADAVAGLESKLGHRLADDYTSEIRCELGAWIAGLADCLGRGALLFVDYGLVRREYYHPQRADGTLICHYRHRAHDDPFLYPGLQDISAWVDFSACADAAREAGFAVAGFTTQAQFLVTAAIQDSAVRPTPSSFAERGSMKRLALPGEMGEKFKLLWVTKGLDGDPLPGRDLRGRL